MEVLKLTDIKKDFGGPEVLRGVSLSVKQGEVVAVIGPSGSGKSTLLRCATLLETIDSGGIAYLGEPAAWTGGDGRAHYADAARLRKIRAGFGLVFQDFHLFPHWTALRNVTDALITVQGQDREAALARGRELLARMDLAGREDAYPYQLSGGQQQRVSIARAMAPDPKILFFDEPTSSLDPELTGEILEVIRTLARADMTMVVVTHEIAFAKNVADRVIFLADGQVAESGTPRQVIDDPQNPRTRAFIGKMLK